MSATSILLNNYLPVSRVNRLLMLLLLSLLSYSIEAQEVRVAVRAHSGQEEDTKKWQPTIDYLNQALPQHRFSMIPYTSLSQQSADARHNKFEFLLTNPSTYVELAASAGAKAILTLVNNRNDTAQSRFGSVIFTHIDHTDILRLQDLKGKNFMAVSRLGFGGWRAGLKVLQDHGLDPDADFANLKFAGEQPEVVEAVRDKRADAGMVRTDMLEQMAKRGDIDLRSVRILNQQRTPGFPFFHSTALYPEWPWAAMPIASPQLTEQVKQALLKIQPGQPAAKAGKYIGWTEPLDYQPVKDLLRDIGVAPFAKDQGNNTLLVYLLLLLVGLLLVFFVVGRYRSKHPK